MAFPLFILCDLCVLSVGIAVRCMLPCEMSVLLFINWRYCLHYPTLNPHLESYARGFLAHYKLAILSIGNWKIKVKLFKFQACKNLLTKISLTLFSLTSWCESFSDLIFLLLTSFRKSFRNVCCVLCSLIRWSLFLHSSQNCRISSLLEIFRELAFRCCFWVSSEW